MFVLVQVSSMKISLPASSFGWFSRHSTRPWRRPVDPARRPGATFFERQASSFNVCQMSPTLAATWCVAHSHVRSSAIVGRPIRQACADRCIKLRELRHLVATLCAHGCFTRRTASHQRLRHIRNAYPQQLGYLTNPLAIVRRREHPLRADPANKPCLADTASRLRVYTQPDTHEIPHINPVSEDPSNSTKPENALAAGDQGLEVFTLGQPLRPAFPHRDG